MFSLRKPSSAEIDSFLGQCQTDTFSYPEVGATSGHAPSNYNLDHNRIKLGEGLHTFEAAKQAIREWKMFDFDWINLYYPSIRIATGRNVAVLARHLGFYSLNASRIVYTIDETNRFGFAYGTLTNHGEIGEERFSVEHDAITDEVTYDLYAFSRPGAVLARLGYPISRYFQHQFADESKQAMFRAVIATLR